MAYDKDQNDNQLPIGNTPNVTAADFLPKYFKTDTNKKFISSTIDQMIKPGVVEKLNFFAGRRYAKAVTSDDNYLADDGSRENYQFEPYSVYKDDLSNVTFLKDYNDYINQIRNFKGSTSNHSLLNKQEFYSWDPHVDWDKLVNFREYYWLPLGPTAISVVGQSRNVISTFTVTVEDEGNNVAYVFTPNGFTRNPNLKFYKGQTYRFEINAPGYPFAFSTTRIFEDQNIGYNVDLLNLSFLYKDGIKKFVYDNEGNLIETNADYIESGVIEFTVLDTVPSVLYYISENNVDTSGIINTYEITENTDLNVDEEIIGKKSYKTANGVELSNGMKLFFSGNIVPEKYAEGFYYVEGVGHSISLVSDKDLEVPSIFTTDVQIPFDEFGFDEYPFEDASSFPGLKDYIVINRASVDRNPWSRYNRWFHRSVIELSAEINNVELVLDQDLRAKRPIIEFEANLKLYNHGSKAKQNINLVDDYTRDVFSTIEGSLGYNVDGVDLVDGMRIMFTADTDRLVNGKIYEVLYVIHEGNRQLTLKETIDSNPQQGETVLVLDGDSYKGKMFFYNGISWKKSQEKNSVNQPPLFDLFDNDENSFNDEIIYKSSNFNGTKLFSYKVGSGTNDNELGFPLSYRNISNIGDIVFEFNLLNDTFEYQESNLVITNINTDIGFLKKYDAQGETFKYVNGWTKAIDESTQPVLRIYNISNVSQNIEIDVFNNSSFINDLVVKVYINGTKQFLGKDYEIVKTPRNSLIKFNESKLKIDDVVLLKCYSSTNKNNNGFYEMPINFEKNPLNENITGFTLGEVNDHVTSIIDDLPNFEGTYPGSGNLRDLGYVTPYGKRFVQHSGPLNLALYHLTDKNSNIVKALKFAKTEYSKFKRNFIFESENTGFHGSAKDHVDLILQKNIENKTELNSFYFSDMIGLGAAKKTIHEIEFDNTEFFALSNSFSLETLSARSVGVYLNGEQLLFGKEYQFLDNFVKINLNLTRGDLVEIYEYESTNGSFIPPTPTKLGLYPKYEPMILVDDTASSPTTVIQGHDGSIIRAFNDYRDELILELEKRIYNNIKCDYNSNRIDIFDFVGGMTRKTGFASDTINSIMLSDFSQWLEIAGSPEFSVHNFWDKDNPFTYNYSLMTDYKENPLVGYWRNVYKQYFDTDRPHSHPWEMLGFTIKPIWWESTYGPAPYTKNNLILWQDLSNGIIREPSSPLIKNKKYERPDLLKYIPVDDNGNLLDPLSSGLAQNFVLTNSVGVFTFGDHSPVETAWRRSSDFPFSLITAWTILQPAKIIGLGFDCSRIARNKSGNLIYTPTQKVINLNNLVFPSSSVEETLVLTSGLVNYIADYMLNKVPLRYDTYKEQLSNLGHQLGIKLGGFAEKSKLKLVLDSRSPLNKSSVFVPEENYNLILNTSNPVDIVTFSGIIIEKTEQGFIINGYDRENPEFLYNRPIVKQTETTITIGGISETFVEWSPNNEYVSGLIVQYENSFYRTNITHRSDNVFDALKFAEIRTVPIVGGITVNLRSAFEEEPSKIIYGTLLPTVQDVVDFMLGYENYLIDQGFKFNYYNKEIEALEDMKFCIREFVFWVTQNWDNGTILTVSPIANQVVFEREKFVVADIFDNFYDYTLLAGNGLKITRDFTNIFRDSANEFGLKPINTADGIFLVKLPLVQKEHVILIDNDTVFNDIIYDVAPGYRQDRIKLVGYRTVDWNGSLSIPGFIYDNVIIKNWNTWTDYAIGDVVKYKEFYYSSNIKHTSEEFFDVNNWNRLEKKPVSELLPNWDYKVNQFTDFYDLDTDNFDAEQQRLGQHLIGYQPREYLSNIITDNVSQYKFYQGFIQDKGTLNSLTKLFDALSSADQDSLEFYEEWAVRLGQYGSIENISEVEYQLNEQKYRLEPQIFELTNSINPNRSDLVYEIPSYDVFLKPTDYNHLPFSTIIDNEIYAVDNGYVRDQDVKLIINGFDDILTKELTDISVGDFVWVTNNDQSWGVYRLIKSRFAVTSILEELELTPDDDIDLIGFRLVFEQYVDLTVGEIVGLTSTEGDIKGFYKVHSVKLNTVGFIGELDIDFDEFIVDSTEPIGLSRFVKRRFLDANDVNSNIKNLREVSNDKIWIDNAGNNTWSVFENNDIFDLQEETPNPTGEAEGFAVSFDINSSNNIVVIGTSPTNFDREGIVRVYYRAIETFNKELIQEISASDAIDLQSNFGQSVAISPDGNYIAVGAPYASNARTKFVGDLTIEGSYVRGDIVRDRGILWRAKNDIPFWTTPQGDLSTITLNDQNWEPVYFIETDNDGTPSGLTNQGVVFLYKKNLTNTYSLIHCVTSPDPKDNEKFGFKVQLRNTDNGNTKLFVGAPGIFNEDLGRIYFLETDNNQWEYSIDRLYKGEYSENKKYNTNDIVLYQNDFYQATTNLSPGTELPGNSLFWNDIDNSSVEHTGYIPHLALSITEDQEQGLSSLYSNIGVKFDVNQYGDVIACSANELGSSSNQIFIYRNETGRFKFTQNIVTDDQLEDFGHSVAINEQGNLIAVGAPRNDDVVFNGGCVYIYKQHTQNNNTIYNQHQILRSVFKEANELFGTGVDFYKNKLAIAGKNTDSQYKTTFDKYSIKTEDFIIGEDDNGNPIYADWINDPNSPLTNAETVFDNNYTTFNSSNLDTGKILLFQNINDYYIFGEDIKYDRNTKFNDISNFKLNDNHLYIGFPELNILSSFEDELLGNYIISEDSSIGVLVDLRSDKNANSWNAISEQTDKVDIKKIKKTFVYSINQNKILQNFDVIDPRQGKIPSPADREITWKTFYDPAVYSINEPDEDENIIPNIIVDPSDNWTEENVGKLWWNLSTASWYNPYQGTSQYRVAFWNRLIPNSSIDVYEWVGSELLPSEWNSLADTNQGFSQGVSGNTLYDDNVYSVNRVYDSVSRTFREKYFYWVKSKKITPTGTNRIISAFDVENLIADPVGQGYRFVACLGQDKFALYNAKSFVEGTDTVLHFTFYKDEELQTNIHTEYQLLTEGLETSQLNLEIERKWFDSLIGYDLNNKMVPDPLLSSKQKYGILNYPRQGMFINRIEAVKQLIERINSILIKNQIVDNYDLTQLLSFEKMPSIISGKYDLKINTSNELSFVGVAKVEAASLIPVIENNKIVRVIIQNPGRGYKNPPSVMVNDTSGSGAIIKTEIDNLGKIKNVSIRSSGKNYSNNTTLTIRKFSVLVENDIETSNQWSIFEWNKPAQSWNRTSSQSFNTAQYWNYVNWYSEGYSDLTPIDYVVDQSYELFQLNDNIGDIVKINSIGSGGWLLLRKINNLLIDDYTVNYETIGRENGTIQLKTDLYDYSFKSTGYDANLYDFTLYDKEPIIEFRNILNSLKHDIFISNLSAEWNNLFFSSLKYVLSEQLYVDWIFKTSFVRATHNLGTLNQKVTFQNDNLENYQDYVNEVKPYSSKIREYISAYSQEEPTNSLVTDFDLPPSYDQISKTIETSSAKYLNNEVINIIEKYQSYPYKNWVDNNAYEIIRIAISDPGEGYINTPTVIVDDNTTARAFLRNGKVSEIEIVNTSGRYLKAPLVTIQGSISTNGRQAKAVAILGNGLVRKAHLAIKFDRVSGDYFITDINKTETFTGSGSLLDFKLNWPVNLKTNSYNVYIDDQLQLSSQYQIENRIDTSKGYDRYNGYVAFSNAPPLNSTIRIEYQKNINLLHAADRINFFYNPTTGMAGKELSQLMDGVEYSGALYDSIDFGNIQGFDLGGFGSIPWDSFDNTYADEIFILDGSTSVFELQNPLEDQIEYNFYVKKANEDTFYRIDDPEYDPSTVNNNANIIMNPVIGDGVTTTITLDPSIISLGDGDTLIIRKITSDGSLTPIAQSYDTQLTGGSFNINSAAGYNPEDIIIDGDGFVTPTTSKGPEELVPGQILDTLDIRVYHKSTDGVGIIGVIHYTINEDIMSYKLPGVPHSNNAIIVKLNGEAVDPTFYNVDWETLSLEIADSSSSIGSTLSIITVGTNGTDVIDSDIITYNNSDIITSVTWDDNLSAFVSINGRVLDTSEYSLTKILDANQYTNKLKIVLSSSPLVEGDLIQYVIYNSLVKTYSQVIIDNTFIGDGETIYHKFDGVENPIPFNNESISHSIIVKVNDKVLKPSYSIVYDIVPGQRDYQIENWQFEDVTAISSGEIIVLVDNEQLNSNEFTFDPASGTITLVRSDINTRGELLRIYVLTDADYYFIDTKVNYSSSVNLSEYLTEGDTVLFESTLDSTSFSYTIKSVDENNIVFQSYLPELRAVLTSENTEFSIQLTDSLVTTVELTDVTYIISDSLTFSIAPSSGANVEIYQFSNHDVNDFRRITYTVRTSTDVIKDTDDYFKRNLLSSGIIYLPKSIAASQYAWVFKNGNFLVPNVDYIVLSNPSAVKLRELPVDTDTIDILQFGNSAITDKFGFRIFKDILNRTHYKRLNEANSYELAQPLNYYDAVISLVDTTGIFIPSKSKNIPGVLFIDGERIEYFAVAGNNLLQLRRGTLGTGVKDVYDVNSKLYGQGPEENINYNDTVYVQEIIALGNENPSTEFDLDFDLSSSDEIEVLVAGKRMRKTLIKQYDPSIAQDSPEGDVDNTAEYIVEGSKIIFKTPPALGAENGQGVKIKIYRKTGKIWNDLDKSLEESNNEISRFIRKATIKLPK